MGFESEAALKSPIRVHELHVVPDFSGGGGVFKIIIGVVLVVVAIVVSILTYGASTPLIAAAISFAAGTGLSLIVGGITELLTPTPKTTNPNGTNDPSRYLGAPQNTTAIGTRIALGYGRYQVFGQFLSFGLQADLTATDSVSRLGTGSASWLDIND